MNRPFWLFRPWRTDQSYRSGRGVDWIKAKCIQTDEFVVAGYLDSTVSNDAIGALVVGFYEGRQLIYCGRVGTGFKRRFAGDLWRRLQGVRRGTSSFATPVDAVQAKDVKWVKPSLVAQVEYRAWTADGLLRHAAFKALREDTLARRVARPGVGLS